MGTFSSSRTFPYAVEDLSPVAQDVAQHFQGQGYDVAANPIDTGGWYVSISKGGVFKAILGLRTALNVEIEPMGDGTSAKARVGIFGQQAIPTMITLFLFWPAVFGQIWGMAQSAGLDDEALATVERSLNAYSS